MLSSLVLEIFTDVCPWGTLQWIYQPEINKHGKDFLDGKPCIFHSINAKYGYTLDLPICVSTYMGRHLAILVLGTTNCVSVPLKVRSSCVCRHLAVPLDHKNLIYKILNHHYCQTRQHLQSSMSTL